MQEDTKVIEGITPEQLDALKEQDIIYETPIKDIGVGPEEVRTYPLTPEESVEIPEPVNKLTKSEPDAEPVFGEYGYILQPGDEGYVEPALNEPHAEQPHPDLGLYTVQAADLNAHTELSEQGVKLYDQVGYDSLWVNKWATGAKDAVVKQAWPIKVDISKGKGITFNG